MGHEAPGEICCKSYVLLPHTHLNNTHAYTLHPTPPPLSVCVGGGKETWTPGRDLEASVPIWTELGKAGLDSHLILAKYAQASNSDVDIAGSRSDQIRVSDMQQPTE